MANECNTCKKTDVDLKKCAKCQTTLYCSRDCQKADWKAHKKVCNSNSQNRMPANIGPVNPAHNNTQVLSPPRGLEQPISKPYTHLHERKWLHDRPEKDVYRLLIDCYRMRMEDTFKFEGQAEAGSAQAGAADPEPSFRRFLQGVEAKPDLLPSWWDESKKEACVQLGKSDGGWTRLGRVVTKAEVVAHYGDPRFPMQLRLFGEQIFGCTPGAQGSNGARIIEQMMSMETTDGASRTLGHLDLAA